MTLARAAGVLLLAAAPVAFAASPLDGFWMKVNDDKSLDPGSQVEYKVEKNRLTMNTPMGATYNARLDGTEAEVSNSPNTTSVSVRLEGRSTLVETSKNIGKAWFVTTMEVDADGKTARVAWKNLKTSQSGSYVLSKQ